MLTVFRTAQSSLTDHPLLQQTGHVADPDMPLSVVKKKLSQVKGHLVTMPIGA